MFKLKRLSDQPILSPIRENKWESHAVFNTAVIYEYGKFHLFYRASDNVFKLNSNLPKDKHKFVSSIGYAWSNDGINFKRLSYPILEGEGELEEWGIEDPRITKIGDAYYMLYTAFGGKNWNDIRISMIESKDLKKWINRRIVLDEPNKDAGLLPEKINGKYLLFHRRMPNIWTAVSDDLKNWYDHRIILKPRQGMWDCKKVGIAGPPLRIDDGWLLIYHGVDNDNVYRLGAAILDSNDPNKVLAVQDEPILEPELNWEINGLVPNVVFSCGACIVDRFLYVYYGAADTSIGVAGIGIDNIKF